MVLDYTAQYGWGATGATGQGNDYAAPIGGLSTWSYGQAPQPGPPSVAQGEFIGEPRSRVSRLYVGPGLWRTICRRFSMAGAR